MDCAGPWRSHESPRDSLPLDLVLRSDAMCWVLEVDAYHAAVLGVLGERDNVQGRRVFRRELGLRWRRPVIFLWRSPRLCPYDCPKSRLFG